MTFLVRRRDDTLPLPVLERALMIRRVILFLATLILASAAPAYAQAVRLLSDINTNPAMPAVKAGCSGAGMNLIWIDSPQYGVEPFVTDGTTEGTHLLKDLVPGIAGDKPVISSRAGSARSLCAESGG